MYREELWDALRIKNYISREKFDCLEEKQRDLKTDKNKVHKRDEDRGFLK